MSMDRSVQAKVALLTIHGMGETPRNYHSNLQDEICKRVGALSPMLHVGSVYYQHILQANERRVWNAVDRRPAGSRDLMRKLWWNDLRKFILYGFGDAAGLESRKDLPQSAYTQAQLCMAKELFAAHRAIGSQGAVVIIAQSLGGQVASCYFWDAQRVAQGTGVSQGIWMDIQKYAPEITNGRQLSLEEIRFLQGATFRTFITTGCNIPIFVAAHAKLDILPIFADKAKAGTFEWHNYFDQDDVLGWPLSPLSPEYNKTVVDHPINAFASPWAFITKSWNPLSHTQYWGDSQVLEELEMQVCRLIEPDQKIQPAFDK